MNILLVGHGGSYNRGCEAIVRSTIDILDRHLESAEITILSSDAESDRKAGLSCFDNVQILDLVTSNTKKYSPYWFADRIDRRLVQRFIPGGPPVHSVVNGNFYRKADVVISVGGDNFTDDYSTGASEFFGELSLARAFGAKTVIWGASIGPFKNRKLEKKWAKHLRKLDLITAREDRTLKYLKSIGVEKNVKRVADPAFLLPTQAEGALSLGSVMPRTLVGLGLSSIVSDYGSSMDKYIDSFCSFARSVLRDEGIHLLLIPHVSEYGKTSNDEEVCHEISTRIGENNRVTSVGPNYNACQTKHIIKYCDYFIGARTHSTIASLSSFVPTISIAYSVKAFGLNEDIFGHTDFVLPIERVDGDSLMEKFTKIIKAKVEIQGRLRSRIPELKEMADMGGGLVAKILNQ